MVPIDPFVRAVCLKMAASTALATVRRTAISVTSATSRIVEVSAITSTATTGVVQIRATPNAARITVFEGASASTTSVVLEDCRATTGAVITTAVSRGTVVLPSTLARQRRHRRQPRGTWAVCFVLVPATYIVCVTITRRSLHIGGIDHWHIRYNRITVMLVIVDHLDRRDTIIISIELRRKRHHSPRRTVCDETESQWLSHSSSSR